MGAERWGVTALVAATLVCVALLPAFPLSRLDDPTHWGVIGYFATLVALVRFRRAELPRPAAERRWLTLFLAAMPVVYLACWLRFGGSPGALLLESLGAAIFGAVALRARRGPPRLLAGGLAAHALWDLAHHGRTPFVPDWYLLACFVVDLGVAAYVISRAPAWSAAGSVGSTGAKG